MAPWGVDQGQEPDQEIPPNPVAPLNQTRDMGSMADPTYRKQAVTRRWEDQGKGPTQVPATRELKALQEKDRAAEPVPVRDPVPGARAHPGEWGHRVEVVVISNFVLGISRHTSE